MRESMSQNPSSLLDVSITKIGESAAGSTAAATAAMVTQAMRAAAGSACRIYIHGNLGAGKTTWVRAFLRACGIEGRIKSPSFSVVESYDHDGITFHHLDFYRQTDPTAWQGGGLRDIMTESAVILVEWPEHASGLPPPHIALWIDWAFPDQADGPRQLRFVIDRPSDAIDFAPGLAMWRESIQKLSENA